MDESHPWRERYNEHLASPAWQATRRRAIERANSTCEICGKAGQLFVHHLHYRTMGHERDGDVVALCRECHELADWYREDRDDLASVRATCEQSWGLFHAHMSERLGRSWWVNLDETQIVFWFAVRAGFLLLVKMRMEGH